MEQLATLKASARGATVFTFAAVVSRLTTAFALTGVLTFAAVVSGLTTALSFAGILSLASMLTFIEINGCGQRMPGDVRNTIGISSYSEGSA